jgi:(p)ppGpp synthase/HD superfamily hydrolase
VGAGRDFEGDIAQGRRMSTLERAIAIAAEAHRGQTDKAGASYILHPLRVMLTLNTNEERITAVLHDIVEDCGWTFERLRAEGFSEKIINAIESVTRRPDENYEDFVLRAARNPIGRRIKLADLKDNADLSRIQNPANLDFKRLEKYQKAILAIAKYMREHDI